MMCLGRSLALDRRFKPRLASEKREQALDMLRNGAAPITVQKTLGLTDVTVRNLRHRDLGDHRNLLHARKLTEAQIAEIRKAGTGTVRRVFAEKFNVSEHLVGKIRNGRYDAREEISPVETTAAKRENIKRPAIGELRLKFSRPLMESLMEMAKLAGTEMREYAAGLLEVQIADWRSRRIPADFLYRDATMPLAMPTAGGAKPRGRFRGKFSADDREKVAEQRDSGVSIQELSERWSCSPTTIRRTLDCQ